MECYVYLPFVRIHKISAGLLHRYRGFSNTPEIHLILTTWKKGEEPCRKVLLVITWEWRDCRPYPNGTISPSLIRWGGGWAVGSRLTEDLQGLLMRTSARQCAGCQWDPQQAQEHGAPLWPLVPASLRWWSCIFFAWSKTSRGKGRTHLTGSWSILRAGCLLVHLHQCSHPCWRKACFQEGCQNSNQRLK